MAGGHRGINLTPNLTLTLPLTLALTLRNPNQVDQKVEAAIRRRPESAAEHLVAMHQEQTTSAAACAPASAVTFEMDVELGEGHGPDGRPSALPPALVRRSTSLGPFDFIVRTLRGL